MGWLMLAVGTQVVRGFARTTLRSPSSVVGCTPVAGTEVGCTRAVGTSAVVAEPVVGSAGAAVLGAEPRSTQ